jgi:hypothetical protein
VPEASRPLPKLLLVLGVYQARQVASIRLEALWKIRWLLHFGYNTLYLITVLHNASRLQAVFVDIVVI